MGAAKRSTGRQHTSRNPVKNAKFGHKTRKIINYSNIFAQMKKSEFLVWGMLEVIFFVLLGSVWCLHFVLRYYCTVRDLHCSRSKMEWKSLLSGVGLPVSMATPSPKFRSGPAVILEPVEAS